MEYISQKIAICSIWTVCPFLLIIHKSRLATELDTDSLCNHNPISDYQQGKTTAFLPHGCVKISFCLKNIQMKVRYSIRIFKVNNRILFKETRTRTGATSHP